MKLFIKPSLAVLLLGNALVVGADEDCDKKHQRGILYKKQEQLKLDDDKRKTLPYSETTAERLNYLNGRGIVYITTDIQTAILKRKTPESLAEYITELSPTFKEKYGFDVTYNHTLQTRNLILSMNNGRRDISLIYTVEPPSIEIWLTDSTERSVG